MAAATVSTRPSTTTTATSSPSAPNSNITSPNLAATKGMTASPRSQSHRRASALQQSDSSNNKESATSTDQKTGDSSTLPTIKPPEDADVTASSGAKDSSTTATANAPLAPPPKPNQNGDGDFFNGNQGQSHLSKEPNPFENAFSSSADTPGKSQLPGVASLTSPAPLLPGSTPGWPGSLRSGPLSPAMLTGPANNDYFNSDHHFAGSFPTPNESSLRSGLTPGGGGSMFPQPSPNSQALYNSLQSGGATPGTLDFHRTAMTARAQTQVNNYTSGPQKIATSQPAAQQLQQQQSQPNPNIQPDLDSKPYQPSPTTNNANQDNHDPFGTHNANDAANGLFMLAQAGGHQQRNSTSFPVAQQQSQQQSSYPSEAQSKHAAKNSVGSIEGMDAQYSDEADGKPPTRSGGARNKKGSTGKSAANGKRKNEETPVKAGNKRQRGATVSEEPDDEDSPDADMQDMGDPDKKMTDEEKRKNFLERNRVAALKCRQRKKQWLANLQQKVEIFSTENDALAATVTQLREEIVGLKTLLLAHKDCPVSQAQGISGVAMQQMMGDGQHYANPYGMAMQGQMPQAQMSRS